MGKLKMDDMVKVGGIEEEAGEGEEAEETTGAGEVTEVEGVEEALIEAGGTIGVEVTAGHGAMETGRARQP